MNGKSKLNWKRNLHGVKVPHRKFQFRECDYSEISRQCEISRRKNCFECEIARACGSYVKRITQAKYYTSEINQLKRLPENEFGYILPQNECDLD